MKIVRIGKEEKNLLFIDNTVIFCLHRKTKKARNYKNSSRLLNIKLIYKNENRICRFSQIAQSSGG